jgi:carbamoyl-phosphate synthase / aspartate carbamoyltransferase / dihydroorotase
MLRLPGLIDVHAHLREPGATHKEDWASGTAAALAGGFTVVLAMPNTSPPVVDAQSLTAAATLAAAGARCDHGLYLGATDANAGALPALAPRAAGLKMYLDSTFGPLRLGGIDAWERHLRAWPRGRPLAVHAEGRSLAEVLRLAELVGRRVHLCHVSRREEILLVRAAKERGASVTCEVTPHHLFLCDEDVAALGATRARVAPTLGTAADRQALWDHLDVVDCIATDHAPHTLAEKDAPGAPPGFPGLETALPLLLDAVREGRLTLDDLRTRLVDNPRRIFALPEQPGTEVEVDPDARCEIAARSLHSRCGWTPFEGRVVHGRIRRVVLRGAEVYRDGEVLAPPGSGRDVCVAGTGP